MFFFYLVLCYVDDVGGVECVEVIDKGDLDVDFGGLVIWILCGDVFIEGF